MKNEIVLNLSRKFWDNYKLFLKEELTRKELEKFIKNLDDAVFFRKYCNHRFNTLPFLEEQAEKFLMQDLREMLHLLRGFPSSTRKRILKKMMNLCFDAACTGE